MKRRIALLTAVVLGTGACSSSNNDAELTQQLEDSTAQVAELTQQLEDSTAQVAELTQEQLELPTYEYENVLITAGCTLAIAAAIHWPGDLERPLADGDDLVGKRFGQRQNRE